MLCIYQVELAVPKSQDTRVSRNAAVLPPVVRVGRSLHDRLGRSDGVEWWERVVDGCAGRTCAGYVHLHCEGRQKCPYISRFLSFPCADLGLDKEFDLDMEIDQDGSR